MYLNIPPEGLACAKTARFKKLGSSAVNMAKLIINQTVHRFNARTDGAFYLRVEGRAQYGLWLVAPDNSLDFTAMASMHIHDALEYMATYCETTPIPGWTALAEWLSGSSGEMGQIVFDSITSITIGEHTTTNVPEWTDPQGNISVFFRWCENALIAAETEMGVTAEMSQIQLSATQFVLPISMTVDAVGGSGTITMALILQI